MSQQLSINEHHHDHHAEDSKVVFGFWIYIMSDCLLFSALFATYAVLHTHTFGGPSGHDLFSMPYVFVETMLLLTSSFTYGLAMLKAHTGNSSKNHILFWLFITFLLGASFVGMEINEFAKLAIEGNSWQRNAFLSSYFALVGTHGLHVSLGLIWMIILMLQVAFFGVNSITTRKLTCLSLFWHFLDIVWIFIFTIVYLMGAM